MYQSTSRYDKNLHPTEYNTAVNGKVNLRIELREDGRTSGIMDNFQPRLPYRPFFLGLNQNTYGTPAGGVLIGGGAFNFNDRIRIEAIANDDSHFVMWSDGESEDTISTNADPTSESHSILFVVSFVMLC